MAWEITREESHFVLAAPCLNSLITSKGSHGTELLSAARLAAVPGSGCASGARWLVLGGLVWGSCPVEYSGTRASSMVQAFFRQASALGRSSGIGCRMSRRKETQGMLKLMLSSARGEEDAVRAYFNTSKESLNKRLPASILYKTHPRDQMSTLLVFGCDVSCTSGAM